MKNMYTLPPICALFDIRGGGGGGGEFIGQTIAT